MRTVGVTWLYFMYTEQRMYIDVSFRILALASSSGREKGDLVWETRLIQQVVLMNRSWSTADAGCTSYNRTKNRTICVCIHGSFHIRRKLEMWNN